MDTGYGKITDTDMRIIGYGNLIYEDCVESVKKVCRYFIQASDVTLFSIC